MYIQIFETVVTSLAVLSAGLSYSAYRGAKKYNDFSAKAANLSAANASVSSARALDSAKYSKESAVMLSSVLAEADRITSKNDSAILAVAKLSSTAGSHAETAKVFAQQAEEQAHTAYVNHLAAKGSMVRAAEHVEKAAAQVQAASAQADRAAEHRAACHDHSIDAEGHSMNAAGYALTAAGHAGVAETHASSVGALSASVARVAAHTDVRLVHRTDYNNEGSNVGGR
jgi:hypothetical protein